MNAKLIQAILSRTVLIGTDGELAEYIARELAEIKTIRQQVRAQAGDRAAAKEDYVAVMNAICQREDATQERCKHWTKTYHGDPSGGRDSHYTCDQCGKEF